MTKSKPRLNLLSKLPPQFVDPVTGYPPELPKLEEQLSALLALFHQRGLIDWKRVNLYLPDKTPSGRMADELFTSGGTILCEYPLFAGSRQDTEKWGSMPADLLYISEDSHTIILIENKIGSKLREKGHLEHGQLARQAKYLLQSKMPERYLVLLSTQEFFDKGWYLRELQNTLAFENRSSMITGYLMQWEEVLPSVLGQASR